MGLLGFRSFVGNPSSGKHQTYDSNLSESNPILQLFDKDTLNKFVVYGGALTLLLLNTLLVIGVLLFGAH
jgi:hypothetical protein